MNELVQNLLYVVITTILPIVSTYFVGYLKAKRAEKLQAIDNTYVKDTITDATDIILKVVETVSQVYVDDLKKNGKFEAEEQKIALNKAISQAKDLLNAETTALLIEKYGDLDTWIRTIIESSIKASK